MKRKMRNRKAKKQKVAQRHARPSPRDYMTLPYKIEITPLSREDGGGYLVTIPLLKGCQSDGRTPDDAIDNLKEAQKAWLTSALKHGDPIPVPQ
jgi:antitoxin HicB